MNDKLKKILVIIVINIFLLFALTPIIDSTKVDDFKEKNFFNSEETELDLLRAEHYLYIDAIENVNSFNIRYSFPPEYGYQVPIIMEIVNDTTAEILNYTIENDTNEPNKIVNFSIGAMEKNSRVLIHFNYWVLVKNYDYSDFPKFVKIPKIDELPQETIKWLSSTKVVQKKNIFIKLRARQLKMLTNNLLKLAFRIAKFCRWHRYLFFLAQYKLGLYRSQDAFATLLINGECPGRSHLGCALFRANNIPARVVLANRNYPFWYEMHYATEYYCPGYGWILTEVHKGVTPYEPKNQIILRICYPEDENSTQDDFIFPKMKGIERWFWIDNQNIKPYYIKDFTNGSKTRMFNESMIFTDIISGDEAYAITKNVFHQYQKYQGMNLTGENVQHFQNATSYQFDAIKQLKNENVSKYISIMNKALDEYNAIVI
ncbi:MAG: transglutaminase-like domain-containing protein [Candidatus Thermoplasmatota archaeon]|jgi:hypothetical protein|nr:transglutaminase-like domain-containing protein [Candidatus Thermoplasmatota archaeon]